MHLSSLRLTQFKNYAAQSFDFSAGLNLLSGLNGMGKTNCLDAIHYLCLCKSQRGLTERDLVFHGADFFRIEGTFDGIEENAEVIVAKYPLQGKKQFERNGVRIERLADHIGQFPVVMIAPDDTELIREGSEERRRFIDTAQSQLDQPYLQSLMLYNRLLKQRNSLLKQFSETGRTDLNLLESIDHQIYAPARLISEKRNWFCAQIIPIFQEYYQKLSEGREQVAIRYASETSAERPMEQILRENQRRDLESGRTTAGLHRDDLVFEMDGVAVKKFASQGQTKSFFLALRLGQYDMFRQVTGKTPLLLLDDVFDKLDETRVQRLMHLIIEKKIGQTFITDTQKNRLDAILSDLVDGYRQFEVHSGQVIG